MGKFDIAAIVGGIAVLVIFSHLGGEGAVGTARLPRQPEVQSSAPPSTFPAEQQARRATVEFPQVVYGRKVKETFQAIELKSIDGDSVKAVLRDGRNLEVRLASIDAPEWNQPFGRSAKTHLQNLLGTGAAVVHQTDTDRYGRTVAFLFCRDALGRAIDINAQMVADGFAWHAFKYSDDPTLQKLEDEARLNRKGLWSQTAPAAPWEHRAK